MVPGASSIRVVPICSLVCLAMAGGLASAAPQAAKLAGRVVDERRFPVAGASVTIHGVPGAEPIVRTTGADGSFSVEVPAGDGDGDLPAEDDVARLLTFFVTTSDRRVGDATERLPRSDEEWSYPPLREPIVVAPCGRLVVDVRDGEGPSPGTSLELRYPHGGRAVTSALTDADGHAVIDPAPVGEFALFAKRAGRGRATVEAKIASGEEKPLRVELRPLRTLAVEFVDADSSEPIPGAIVEVRRTADGPNPDACQQINRREDFVAVPQRSDERGRLELRDLEAESMLTLDPSAPHHAELVADPFGRPHRGEQGPSRAGLPWRRVSADAGSVRIEMKRLKPKTVRWRIIPGSAQVPPDGTSLEVRWHDDVRLHYRREDPPTRAVIRDGAVEIEEEARGPERPPVDFLTGWAEAPDGSIAELARPRGPGGGTACFAPGAALVVKLRAADGTPERDEPVSIWLEAFDESRASPRQESKRTDRDGVARFKSLRAGRFIVVAGGIERVVRLGGGETAIELDRKAADVAEVVLAFTIDGERRLPARWSLWTDGEDVTRRREDPARGELHIFVTRPAPGCEIQVSFAGLEWEQILRPLALPPGPGPLVVPFPVLRRGRGEAIARVRGAADLRAFVVLERQDQESGRFERLKPDVVFNAPWNQDPREEHRTDLRPGNWRLAVPEMDRHGEPARVVEGGAPAELELDLASVAQVGVVWKVPAGEDGSFLDLEAVEPKGPASAWNGGEPEWPLAPVGRARCDLRFDRTEPPPLVIRHPYLVGSKGNDAIDLRNPRSTITLHVEPGPLLTFTPAFERDVPFVHGAFVTLTERGGEVKAPDRRRALRRGDQFAMAPPAAGRYRVLIDPVAAAPVEFDDVTFDGGPRDLGPIRFAPGSTLHVHARATAPFAPPRLTARAVRIDGLPYERLSSIEQSARAPNDPELAALGPGRFRITLECVNRFDARTFTTEAEVDGIHDAEVEIVAE